MDRIIIEYSEDGNEVCLMPNPSISLTLMTALMRMQQTIGFKYWLPSDERLGYRFAKEMTDVLKEECKKALGEGTRRSEWKK
jgi:hypothetical protein